MSYQIIIEKRAQKFIRKQPRPQQERVLRAISKLPDGDVKQLQGNYRFMKVKKAARFLRNERLCWS